MGFGVFMHRSDSRYEDVPAVRYQFPRQYLSRVEACVGDWIVYLEPSKVPETRGYFAVAQVDRIVPDPTRSDMFNALVVPQSYLDFGTTVPFNDDDGPVERGLLNEYGRLSGRAQSAVRALSPEDFARITGRGLASDDAVLPRNDATEGPGMNDPVAPFLFDDDRSALRELTSRTVRDRNFRRVVLRAYADRCAITGLRLINGGGRAEAEAAHIRPVEHGGLDIISNGIALSGTVHWMFDRGLIGLSDDMKIEVSRQVNDPGTVGSLINSTGHLLGPARPSDRPHPAFLAWHREHCFKH
ncbi:MAG: HNH endonuclease [Pseudomonadota bacterium]